MQRKIKFRAWNIEEKKYYYKSMDFVMKNLSSTTNCEDLGMTSEEYIDKLNWIGFDDIDYLDWIIEQYTGLKDENGVEIYEGDIVYLFDDEVGVIKWDGADAMFIIEIDNIVENFSYIDNKCVEVVGNIHEVK